MKTLMTLSFNRLLTILFIVLSLFPVVGQTIELPAVIGDNMVVQRDKTVKKWENAEFKKR